MLKQVCDALQDSVAVLDDAGRIVAVNQAWRDFGARNGLRDPAAGLNANYLELCDRATGADGALARAAADGIRGVLAGAAPNYQLEYPCHSPDQERWFLLRVARFFDHGRAYAVVIHEDITQRKRVETALERSQGELRAIYEHAPVLMCVLDARRNVLYANRAFTEFTGKPECDVAGARACGVFGCINARNDPRGCGFGSNCADCQLRLAIEDTLQTDRGHRDIEYRATLEQGGVRRDVVLLGATDMIPTAHEPALLLCLHDVTEREKSKAEREKIAAELNAAQRIAHIGSWQWNTASDTADWSEETFRIFGLVAAPFAHHRRNFLELVHPDDRARVEQALTDAVSGKAAYDLDYRILPPDGREKVIHAQGEVLRRADGAPWAMRGTVQDITERHAAQAKLWASEERHRLILEGAGLGIGYYDPQGRLILFNTKAAENMGGAAADFAGRTVDELFDPPLAALIRERIGAALQREGGCEYEDYVTLPTGKRWFHSIYSRVPDSRGGVEGVQIISMDITQRKAAEEQAAAQQAAMAHLSRVVTMGELASGIAHEINQPLGAGLLFAETCRDLLKTGVMEAAEMTAALGSLIAQLERARATVARLRKFLHKQKMSCSTVDVNQVVRDAAALLAHEIVQARVSLVFELEPRPPLVIADAVLIQQVVINLALNALEAMRTPGDRPRRLTLGTTRGLDGSCTVAVGDTGPGVAPELAARLFESFITNKPQGMGLGLAISRSIIEQHEGRIWHEPAEGGGAAFKFALPAAPSGHKGVLP